MVIEGPVRALSPPRAGRPRLGFLGVGWIGRHRLRAVAESGMGEILAIGDAVGERAAEVAAEFAPECFCATSADQLFARDLDGVVIATPSGLHAEHAVAALERGLHVFCQKPLGRNRREAERIVAAARACDRRLGVDLCYRFIPAMQAVRRLVQSGELGRIFAVELVFHNAYGPDKAWARDGRLAGGGCLIDLATHLVDLALWTLPEARVMGARSRLFSRGEALQGPEEGAVEDFALGHLDLRCDGQPVAAQIACSWEAAIGRGAVIAARFYGTKGGAAVRNVDGSFFHFLAERFHGATCQPLDGVPKAPAAPEDSTKDPWAWGRWPILEWLASLAHSPGFDPASAELTRVPAAIEALYRGNVSGGTR